MVVTDKGFLLVPVDRPHWIIRGRIGSKKVRPICGDLRYFSGIWKKTRVNRTMSYNTRLHISIKYKRILFYYPKQMESIKDQVLTTSHPVYSQVARVIGNIVNANQDLELMKNQTWTLILVDSKEKNAFVLPVSKCKSLISIQSSLALDCRCTVLTCGFTSQFKSIKMLPS